MEALGEKHFRVGFDYYGLALSHWDLKDYASADEYSKKAFDILPQILGAEHPIIADVKLFLRTIK